MAAGASKKARFTYHADEELKIGQTVSVSLGQRASIGVISSRSAAPDFPTKPINKVFPLPPLPLHLLKLADWLAGYYATALGRVWQTILPPSLYSLRAKPVALPKAKLAPELVQLVPQQIAAVEAISNSPQAVFLLYGATGSGKTQVYIELARQRLAANESVIMLVPEISLTPQLQQAFTQEFGNAVIVTHSGLTQPERRATWQAILTATEPRIVIGPRSALFAPLKKLGLIIIDESHDTSYKQDQSPRYHATPTAAQLAKITGAKLVLGTATPSVFDMYFASIGRIQLIEMPEPIFRAQRSRPIIVDLKDKSLLRASYLLSDPLVKQLRTTLASGKQSILFLNRRGSARALTCRACGWVAKCPNCQIPLTWHADQAKLVCHWCGYVATPPPVCPECGSLALRFLGSGTQRLETEVARLLPAAKIARLDQDSFDAKSITELYEQLKSGAIDILLGTQMITKGLDLPGVETIGIVLADTMLYLPDFSATERTFQLLFQVSGRAGRRDNVARNLIVQTYSPANPVVVAAAQGDYASFVENELAERRTLGYPPFVYLLKLTVSRGSRESAEEAASDLAKRLRMGANQKYEVIGPAPSWRETLGGHYHWQLILKAKKRSHLVDVTEHLPAGWTPDLDPIDLL